jgi:hypothetical protein
VHVKLLSGFQFSLRRFLISTRKSNFLLRFFLRGPAAFLSDVRPTPPPLHHQRYRGGEMWTVSNDSPTLPTVKIDSVQPYKACGILHYREDLREVAHIYGPYFLETGWPKNINATIYTSTCCSRWGKYQFSAVSLKV